MKEPTIVFLDTETTDISADARLIQIAYKVWKSDEQGEGLFRPPEGVELNLVATSVHHITKKHLEGKPLFEDSQIKKRLQELFDSGAIMVAHNAAFDLDIIKKEGLVPQQFICTLKVARFMDEKAEMANHKLQYLRYFHDLEVDGKAHDAEGDVTVLQKLFEVFVKNMAIEKMIDISSRPSLIRKFSFGKYKDELVEDVAKKDKEYLKWFLQTKKNDDSRDEDWIYTLTEILK